MTLLTSDQGIVMPASGDVNDGPTAFASELGANPSTGASGTGGTESRLVKRYLSATDRSARNASPAAGEMSYRADIADYEAFTGSVWRKPWWNTAWGVIGGARFSASGSGVAWNNITGTEAVVTSAGGNFATPSINLIAGRRYRVTASIRSAQAATTQTLVIHIRENNVSGNIITEDVHTVTSLGQTYQLVAEFENASARSVSYVVSANTGGGTAQIFSGSSSADCYITVNDVGPAGIITVQTYP